MERSSIWFSELTGNCIERQSLDTFVINTDSHRIGFEASITKTGGLYFKPTWNYCKTKDRRYNAMRYQYKFISTVREVAFELRKKGVLSYA